MSLDCDYHDVVNERYVTCLRRSSLFTLYARIFRLLLSKREHKEIDEESDEDEYEKELDSLVLPSNEEWRLSVYYRLVELQRENDLLASNTNSEETSKEATQNHPYLTRRPDTHEDCTVSLLRMNEEYTAKRESRKTKEAARSQDWEWEPNEKIAYPITPKGYRRRDSVSSVSSFVLEASVEPGWRLRDILLAARLLLGQRDHLEYADEAEMRRVFGLVYDVLRYKKIFDRALVDVGFWIRHGHLKQREKVVWLLLYDLQGRKFSHSGGTESMAMRNQALKEVGSLDVEKALLQMKTRLAASLSRLRIGGSALSLDELLPAHLRTAEGVTWGDEGAVASGWVNSARLPSRRRFIEEMQKLGLSLCIDCSNIELGENQYVFDPICPRVVNLHEKARERLAVSQLVRNYSFIFLERSLCIGAAALVQSMRVLKLCGPVILTHSLAPRHTGYLAELLSDFEEAGRLLAFGAGENCEKHQQYLEKLGISIQRCKFFSENYTSAPSSTEVEQATIVLATPPCSFTGIRDVVDLAIARGGDMELLETLTSLEAECPQQPRALLADQMATLKYALTRPNVQLLVYEVHTLLPSETTEMIQQAIDQANKMAVEKYLRSHPQKKKTHSRESTSKKAKVGKKTHSVDQIVKGQDDAIKSNVNIEDDIYSPDVTIPDSDLFEVANLSELYQLDYEKYVDPGSFVILVKRKEIMQFNSLFMIKVAEAKGVFGEPTKPEPKIPEPQLPPQPEPSHSSRKKRGKFEIDRISAPTHATILRILRGNQPCPRHQQRIDQEESWMESQVREARRRDARRWWIELARLWRRNAHRADDYQFQALRTDPVTNKILFPSHVMLIDYEESQRASLNLP